MKDTFTSMTVSIIMVAIVSMLVTRKGIASSLTVMSHYLVGAIRTLLGSAT